MKKVAHLVCNQKKRGQYPHSPLICIKCGKVYLTDYRKHKKGVSKYCSIYCANSRIQTVEMNEARRKKLSKDFGNCSLPNCNNKLLSSGSKYCSRKCSGSSRIKNNNLDTYRRMCKFQFNLADYDEFNFDLVKKYGWYKPVNRGNNLEGVSRDHKLSVSEGYKNNIDPKIISHPANCELIRQRDNSSKHSKSSTTLEDLLKLINVWDIKYST